jgi:hypothetical protein
MQNESLMTHAVEMSSLTHEVLTWSGDRCGGWWLMNTTTQNLLRSILKFASEVGGLLIKHLG